MPPVWQESVITSWKLEEALLHPSVTVYKNILEIYVTRHLWCFCPLLMSFTVWAVRSQNVNADDRTISSAFHHIRVENECWTSNLQVQVISLDFSLPFPVWTFPVYVCVFVSVSFCLSTAPWLTCSGTCPCVTALMNVLIVLVALCAYGSLSPSLLLFGNCLQSISIYFLLERRAWSHFSVTWRARGAATAPGVYLMCQWRWQKKEVIENWFDRNDFSYVPCRLLMHTD